MKHLKLTMLLIMLWSIMGTNAYAHDLAVENADGVTIYYDYINEGKELEVTSKGEFADSKAYSGNVVIPHEVTYMGRTRKVTSIGEKAFLRCSGLTSVTIPNSVTSIGKSAFDGCSGLTSVTIPNSVTSIGELAFWECSGLTSVTIPNSVISIGHSAFRFCSSLTSVTIPNSVTVIGSAAFMDCSGLTSVTIPNSITSIAVSTFHGCSGLTSVTIPNSVISIDGWAFQDCSGLTSVTIPNSVTSIGENAFKGCSGLTSVTIPNRVADIGNSAFQDCSSLTSVTIPNSVTSIGEDAFVRCKSLTSVHITDLAAWCKISFDDNPFNGTHHLYMNGKEVKDLVIPNSVTSIGNYAFDSCDGLTSVSIPNSVTSIGKSAFAYCDGLTSVNIPNSVTYIGEYAFSYCGLTSLTIPSSLTSISKSAFSHCNSLTSVTIPNSVTSIGEHAFANCVGLTSVTIPNSVTSIGKSAFWNCDNLLTVVTLIKEPFGIYGKTSSYHTFSQNTFMNATLYVPVGTIEKYKSTEGWKDFLFMEEGTGGIPEPKQCTKPTISYKGGKLSFSSKTEGATCQYTITDSDIKSGSGNEVKLSVTYNISVYATKAGYDNSETATATLCWIDQQPKTEGVVNGVAEVPARAFLIKSDGGNVTVEGADDGEHVGVYTLSGMQAGSTISQNGMAVVGTNLQKGEIVIVKVGEKSVKVVMK